MDNKKIPTLIGTFIIIVIAITVGVFVRKVEKNQEGVVQLQNITIQPKPLEKNQETTDKSNWKTYTNNDFNFSFKYPDGENGALLSVNNDINTSVVQNSQYGAQLLNIKEWNGGTQRKPQDFYFYINIITAKDAKGKTVTNAADFVRDYPLRRIHRIREESGLIDNIPTIEDIWPTIDSDISGAIVTSKESKTVYVYYKGLIYEITIISKTGIPADIMSTFHFLVPNNVTSDK